VLLYRILQAALLGEDEGETAQEKEESDDVAERTPLILPLGSSGSDKLNGLEQAEMLWLHVPSPKKRKGTRRD